MTRLTLVMAMVLCAVGAQGVSSQTVHSGDGTPMRTPLIGGVHLNDSSSLVRQWTIVNDAGLPARISADRFMGVTVGYADRNFEYRANFRVEFDVPVSAFRVVFVTFDIWNERVTNLAFSEVGDIAEGGHGFSGRWRLLRESEASNHYLTLAYVDRVRLPTGEVLHANRDEVLIQARRISSGISEEDLLSEN